MISIEKSAKTVNEAIDLALAELNVGMSDVEVEVLSNGSKGLLGIGSKLAKVKVTLLNSEEESEVSNKEEVSTETKVEVETVQEEVAPKKESRKKAKNPYIMEDGSFDEEAVKAKAMEFLNPILDSLGVKAESSLEYSESTLSIVFKGKNLGAIIGRRGETLDSLQYLTNLSVNLGLAKEDKIRVIIDVEGYRENREKTLIALAHKMAEKTKHSGRDVILEPMNPQERRIIHMALQDDPDVKTFSQGEEPYRKVIITRK